METSKNTPQNWNAIIRLALRGIALAMAVAVTVLGILGTGETKSMIAMLAMGLFGLALSNLDGED